MAHPVIVANKMIKRNLAFILTPLTAWEVEVHWVRQPAEVSPAEFEIQPGPDDVVFEGEASNDPVADMIGAMLREFGRVKGR